MEKVIQLGSSGSITVSVSAGVASVAITEKEDLGGGAAAGVLKVSGTAKAELGAQQAADLALALLEGHFPSLAGILEGAKTALDAELAKL